jgi:carbohydrate-selective porin OprB
MLRVALLGLAVTSLAAFFPVAVGAQDLWQQPTLTGDWGGLRTGLENAGVTFALQQQSELWANAAGGLGQGGAAGGLLTASLAVDLDKAIGWPGGNLFAGGFEVPGGRVRASHDPGGPRSLLLGRIAAMVPVRDQKGNAVQSRGCPRNCKR